MPSQPNLEQWRKAYQLAQKLYSLYPWNWMFFEDVFAFRETPHSDPYFASLDEGDGTYIALAVYRDTESFFRQLDLSEASESGPSPVTILMEIPKLELSFESKEHLYDSERRQIKKLGFTFQGSDFWPHFQSNTSGFLPSPMDSRDLELTCTAIEHTLRLTSRLHDNPDALEDLTTRRQEQEEFLVIAPDGRGGWQERFEKIPHPPEEFIAGEVDSALVQRVKALPRTPTQFEVGLVVMDRPIRHTPDSPPFFPFLLMVAESTTCIPVGYELLTPEPDFKSIYSRIPSAVLRILAENQTLPIELRVCDRKVARLLMPHFIKLGIPVRITDELPAFAEVAELAAECLEDCF